MEERRLFLNMNYHTEAPSMAFSKDKPLEEQPDQSQSYQLPFHDLSASASRLVKSSSTDLRGKPPFSRKAEPDANISQSDAHLELHPLKQTQTKIPNSQPATSRVPNDTNSQETLPCTDYMSASKQRDTLWFATKEDQCRERHKALHEFRSKDNPDTHGQGWRRQSWTLGSGGSPAYQETAGQEDEDLTWQVTAEGDASDALVRRRRWSSFVPPEQRRPSSRDRHFGIHTCGDMKKLPDLPNGARGAQRRRMEPPSGGSIPDPTVEIHWLILVSLAAYVLSTVPLASYVTGMSVGVACGFISGLLLVCALAARCSRSTGKPGNVEPSSDPVDAKPTDLEILEGWLNQADSYNLETFHQSATHPVFASLAGSLLRLSYPQASDEPTQEMPSLTYQLANCQVSLAHPALARKRLWNKKYPICITLAKGEVGEENLAEGHEGEGAKRNPGPPEHNMPPVTLCLFACTRREKEWWFENFRSASRIGAASCENTDTSLGGDPGEESTEEHPNLPEPARARKSLDYRAYMAHLVDAESCVPAQDSVGEQGGATAQKKVSTEAPRAELSADSGAGRAPAERQTPWLNSLSGRIFLCFLQDQYWTDMVAYKIQQKLLQFKVKYFLNELVLIDLDMGTCQPQILSISKPTLDQRGLWLDLEIVYKGCFQMTLQSKLNLSKLDKEDEDACVSEAQQERVSKLSDSDESSSGASSDEEDIVLTEGDKRAAGAADMKSAGKTSMKIGKFMDKISKSRYFQKAREHEHIRKKIAEVTNMPLMLTVDVLELSGTLAVNIPPPPSDRIWYSFREPPELDLCVHPMLGQRKVTFTEVTEWIERKLKGEFQAIRTLAESASSPPTPDGGLRTVDENAHWLL